MEAEVKRLLLPVADEIIERGLNVRVVVGFGRPVDGILQHIQENDINLVIMSTHGHSGLHPYAYGGTADRVARHSPVPVLLVRPEEIRHMMPLPRLPGVE
jgi:nucleotide-binding universal stress UspA family protein